MPLTNAILIKDKAVIGGGSSGGGHTNQDNSGTNMSQQPTLQFTGDVEVANDEENQKTIVNIPKATEITWDEWQELPDEEKEQGKWDITGAPGADGTIKSDLLTKLWENPNPTAKFPAQEITLSSDDYDFRLWIYKNASSSNYHLSRICEKNQDIWLDIPDYNSSTLTASNRYRVGVYNASNGGYSISDATINGTTNNAVCIPVAIYGFKSTIDLKISAIASDVSTSASKCMMSDGTSVEDSIMSLEHAYESPDDINVLASQVIKLTRSTTGEEYSSVYTIPKDCYAEVSISVQGNGSGASNLAYLYLLPRYTTNVSTAVNNNKRIILLSLGSISAEGIVKTIYLKKGSVIGAYLNVRSSGNANISVGLRETIYKQ